MGYSAKQRKVKTKVEGADKLVKDIRAMEDAASSVLMTGAKAGGKIALDDARRNCPVDTGTLKASLKLNEGKGHSVLIISDGMGKGSSAALDGVTLAIERGSFTVILGHNGSGKSTLAKTFNAVLLPSVLGLSPRASIWL